MNFKDSPPEDTKLPELDPFAGLLLELWQSNYSVNGLTARRELRVYPVPSERLVERMLNHYDLLAFWLPGECDNCHAWVMQRVECYWGAHPHLCPNCMAWVMSVFESKDAWPQPTWHEGEK